MKLNSSVSAIVTGGASGLGAATVRRLAEKGVKIAVFDLEHQKEKAEALFQEIGGGVFCPCNVTSEEEVDAAFAKARAANGQERILVNCAGTGNAASTASRDRKTGEIKPFPTDRFNLIIQINLVGTFRCIAKSAAGMMTPGAAGRRRARRDRQHRLGGGRGRPDRPGGLHRLQGRRRRPDPGGGARPVARKASAATPSCPASSTPRCWPARRSRCATPWARRCRSPSASAVPEEYASLAMEMIQNGYFNGEDVRLDGAIRMAPR